MPTLGIGSRVYCKWCPPDMCSDGTAQVGTGTIVDGPYPPGVYKDQNGRPWRVRERMWEVRMDVTGDRIGNIESLLWPLDDGDAESDEDRTCLPAMVE